MRRALLPLLLTMGCHSPTPAPVPIEAEGLHNVYRLTPRLLSGGSPEGDGGFRSLTRLGVKTVLSVDGARPDVARAKAAGLRYVHLPIGYHGLTRERGLEIARAVRDLPGPVYLHCHHGKHRGPAAAAVAMIALEGCTPERAEAWLALAGTGKNYTGLQAVPRGFAPPKSGEMDAADASFPEAAEVSSLARLMVELDARYENLKQSRAAGWRPPAAHPDIDPPHEALMLAEGYREMARLDATRWGKLAADAEAEAGELGRALRQKADAEPAFARLAKTCAACHARHRDVPGG